MFAFITEIIQTKSDRKTGHLTSCVSHKPTKMGHQWPFSLLLCIKCILQNIRGKYEDTAV